MLLLKIPQVHSKGKYSSLTFSVLTFSPQCSYRHLGSVYCAHYKREHFVSLVFLKECDTTEQVLVVFPSHLNALWTRQLVLWSTNGNENRLIYTVPTYHTESHHVAWILQPVRWVSQVRPTVAVLFHFLGAELYVLPLPHWQYHLTALK